MTMPNVPEWMLPLAPLLMRECAPRVVLLDAMGRLLRATPELERALAGAGADPGAVHWDALWAPPAVADARQALQQALGGGTGRFRAPMVTTDGRWGVTEVTVHPTSPAAAAPAAAVAVLRDVSEMARLERALVETRAAADRPAPPSPAAPASPASAPGVPVRRGAEQSLEELNRRKDEFLATLAHELRNPLAPIRTATELLQLDPADPEVSARALGILRRQVDQLVRLVDDLVDVNRISRGEVELRLAPVEIAEVVDAALEISRPRIEAARHALVVEVPGAGLQVRGDRARLAQALSNVLNNAAKYTPAGGCITVRAAAHGDEAVLLVSDTGAGLPADKLEEVFELFTRVKTPSGTPTDGLGIGLALVRRLVALHGGVVRAQSPGLGRGTTIELRLPLRTPASARGTPPHGSPTANPAPSAARPAAPAVVPRRRPLRILLVDDNVDAAVSQGVLLELRQHVVRVAHTGAEALQAAGEFAPQVALLDLRLPDTTGYVLARALRQLPGGDRLVCVAQTGWEESVDAEQQEAAGFTAQLVKPVDWRTLDQLLESVARAIAPVAP
ncbi:MAG: response regulator [Gemmatimonadetes bacterium]|nr:response regulator [Gemmatimonadota bacterium]